MKVTVERGALLKALGHAAGVVERRNTIPVLSNVLLEAEGEALKLTATDLELQIRLPVPASVADPGAVTVQAALLLGIVRELADGCQVELTLDSDNHRLSLVADRARYKLQTLPATDFPVMALDADACAFEMQAAALKAMLGKVAHAISTDPSRYYLNGACLEAHAGALVLAATDGAALAHASIEAPEGSTELGATIIPRKAVGEIADLIGDAEGLLELAVTTKQVRVTIGDIELTTKLIDGAFPDWRRVVPASNPHRLSIHREALAAAIRRAIVMSVDKVRSVRVDLSAEKVTVTAHSQEHGEGAEDVPAVFLAETITDMAIGFNAKLLLDTFAAMGGDELEVRLADPAAPALFINPADDAAQWVVMPMRV
jgi:DNA polymerase-3 subunit beta